MNKIKILTDINSDLTENYIKENNIDVVPMYYRFDSETVYGDEINLSISEFYDKFKKTIPKTMGCNPEKIREKLEKAIKDGYDVLCIMFSGALSVSYNSALVAKEMIEDDFPDANIEVINSKRGSLAEGYMVKEAKRLSLEGLSIKQIKEHIESNLDNFRCLFSVASLEALVRSGRISQALGVVGNLASIKPIFGFDEEGNIAKFCTKRGLNKVIEEISDRIKEFNPKEITIAHANDKNLADKIKDYLINKTGIKEISIVDLNFCTASCGGESSFGISFYK